MDVSPTLLEPFTRSPITDFTCDACGYPRRGLPDATHCPECGAPPPAIVAVPGLIAHVRTRAELRWLRTVAAGLVLLLVCWAAALRVALVVPAERLSTVAI